MTPDLSTVVELIDDLHPEPDLSSFQADLPNVPAVVAAVLASRAAQQQADSYKLALVPSFSGSFTEFNTNAPSFEPSRWYYQAAITATWTCDLTYIANIRSYDAAARASEQRTRLDAVDAIHRYWQTVLSDIAQEIADPRGQGAMPRFTRPSG
jgi:outer membrane protein TolC